MTKKKEPAPSLPEPTPAAIFEARIAAGMGQAEAAELVYLGHFARWSEYERGKRNMPLGTWELFLLRTGLHPLTIVKGAGA